MEYLGQENSSAILADLILIENDSSVPWQDLELANKDCMEHIVNILG